jgi:hypothetical protein
LFHFFPFCFANAFRRLALTPLIAIRRRSVGLNLFARTVAALLEMADRSSWVNALARASPPSLPNIAAASFLFIATILLA